MDAIVVGTDGSPDAEAAVQKVVEMAGEAGEARPTVHLVCAYPGKSALERIGLTAKQDPVDMRGVAADVLARAERRLVEAGFTVEKSAREGDPARTIIEVAKENGAGMIVVGAHGTAGDKQFHIGSVASKLSHHAPTSLLIVRED
jgi:nucleotide-binding universal stress UspA family protein